MEDDTLYCWCPAAGCSFKGYVVQGTGKILRQAPDEEMADWDDGEGACLKCQGGGCDPEGGCVNDE